MKKWSILIGCFIVSSLAIITAQTKQNSISEYIQPLQQLPPGTIEWQNTIGGNNYDELSSIKTTNDGGYLLSGYSSSNISGDKNENNYPKGDYDVWLIKLDSLGSIKWQKTIKALGNQKSNYINSTSDGGYILGGWSQRPSDSSGSVWSNPDYWVVRLDVNGNILWQKFIGGANGDVISSIEETAERGFIIGGFSNSDISFEKTENSVETGQIQIKNSDYWVVKLDSIGNIEWQNTIGGRGSDQLSDIHQTKDGGFIIGGSSNSDQSGDKTETSFGSLDYWIIKLDQSGNLLWQTTIGGSGWDELKSLSKTDDGGFIIGGQSSSNNSGVKTVNNKGGYDFWVVKLDASGKIMWQNALGGNQIDNLTSIQQSNDGGYIVGGYSSSNKSGDKSEDNYGGIDFWVVKLDATGSIEWQKTLGGTQNDILTSLQKLKDGNYIVGGYSYSNISGIKSENCIGIADYWILKLTGDCVPVSFASQPSNIQAAVNSTATFNVAASGTAPFIFQWRKNGINIPNATNSNYTTPPVTLLDNGAKYSCVIKNCNGTNSVTSNNAILTVCSRPTIQATNPTLSNLCSNTVKINWTNGNGTRRIVKIHSLVNFTAPVNGTDPVASTNYTGVGEQVIYNGTGNSVTITGLRPRFTYYIRVYEANCDGTNSIYFTQTSTNNPQKFVTQEFIELTLSSTPTCFDAQTGTASVAAKNGGGNYTYLWNTTPVETTKDIIGKKAGEYLVTVTSIKGCVSNGKVNISTNPEITATTTVSNIDNPPYTITVNANGGKPPYKYRIKKSNKDYKNSFQDSNVFSNLEIGIYFIEIKDTYGCVIEISESVGKKGDCPYPIIFIHGWSGDESTWRHVYNNSEFKHIWGNLTDIFESVNNATDLTDINGQDGNLGTKDDDVLIKFNNENNSLKSGCLYVINMKNWWNEDPNNPRIKIDENHNNSYGQSESNESAILKSGYVIKNAIDSVLKATGKDKVILFCHSMGGLGAREYLQRTFIDANGIKKHRWWKEESENKENGHHVAKLFTVSTPHRGSNKFGNIFGNEGVEGSFQYNSIIPNIKSEALRDMRWNYQINGGDNEDFNYQGVYLYGGSENIIANKTRGLDFHNYDVDCNGNETSEEVIGINQIGNPIWNGTEDNQQMKLPKNVRYTYYVGNLTHDETDYGVPLCKYQKYGCGGDCIVDDKRQWLYSGGDGSTDDFIEGKSIPRPQIEDSEEFNYILSDRITSENKVDHTSLTTCIFSSKSVLEDIDFLIRGIDESDYPEFAYLINSDVKYSGMAQIRPEKIPQGSEYKNSTDPEIGRRIDGDWYKIVLPKSEGKYKIKIVLNQNKKTIGRIDFYPNRPAPFSNENAPEGYFKTFNINETLKPFTIPDLFLPDTYYIRITHNLNFLSEEDQKLAWQNPYDFTVTLLNSNIKELTNRANEKNIVIGEVYPNPFNSSFNVDIDNLSNEVILKVELTLSNSLNQIILTKSEELIENENIITIPASELSSGVYYLTVKIKDELKTYKLIKI